MPAMSRTTRRQLILVTVFLILVVFFVTTYRMGVVRGDSMQPTYENGQVVLVRRRNWFSPPLQKNDVVLLRRGRDVLIKRVHRLPGEEINDWFLKQQILLLGRVSQQADYYEQEPGRTPEEGTRFFVPENYIFVLGDNQRASEDSRQFGPVPLRDVLGVVVDSPPPPNPEAFARPSRSYVPPSGSESPRRGEGSAIAEPR
jgi:signal peptidase I